MSIVEKALQKAGRKLADAGTISLPRPDGEQASSQPAPAQESVAARIETTRRSSVSAWPDRSVIIDMDHLRSRSAMQIAYNDAEIKVKTLEAQVREQRRQVNNLRQMVDTIPEVEAQLTRLNRDYDVMKTQYEALLSRLESARLTENAEQNRNDLKFQIIEPPAIPIQPSSPNRMIFLAIVLVMAIGGGAVLALFLHQINPVFSSKEALREVLGYPVLGALTLIRSASEKSRQRAQATFFGLAASLLLLAFVAVEFWRDSAARTLQALLGGDVA